MSVASVGELYLDQPQGGVPDSWGKNQGDLSSPTPPSAPASIPPPTPTKVEVTVSTKRRMADETPDGKIRDTSTEAMREGNDLGLRRFEDEKPEPTAPAAAPAAASAAAPPVEPKAPEPPKVYAGKFKTPEDLEKSYQELERKLTQTSQEKAELARQAQQPKQVEQPKTPQQVAADEQRKNEILQQFVNDPEKFLNERERRASEQAMVAVQTERMRSDWLKSNPDLAELEKFVAVEAASLVQTDPELAVNPTALLQKATDNFRQITGKIRSEAAKEALTKETRVIPLVSNAAPPAATEQPAKAPLSADEAYSAHMRMLKEQERKSHRGLRP